MKDIKCRIIKTSIVIFTIILIVSSYILIRDFLEYKESKAVNIQIFKDAVIEENDNVDNERIIEINWDKLKRINKDIIGWIRIADTNINYPILKSDETLNYMNHSFNGEYNKNGSIFTLNGNPFNDNVTVIYGHNMKSGIMFSQLAKYMNEEFFYKHPNFEIYTENQNYRARVFSCYSIGVNDDENNIKSLDFKEEIEYYKKSSKHCIEDIGEIEKIVKLSTCSYLNNHTTPTNQRYYIIASLEKLE